MSLAVGDHDPRAQYDAVLPPLRPVGLACVEAGRKSAKKCECIATNHMVLLAALHRLIGIRLCDLVTMLAHLGS